ncbi:MAG: hypothetical protein JRD04_01540 [Deltaproteobacteria bacterium]|nr:hypothetical protein [Deltaproteobacteria bacterium]
MAKVKMGGIIFTDFYYIDRDAENSQFLGLGNDSYQVTTIQVPSITRLYGRWTNEDNVGMYIEIGIGQTSGGVNYIDSKNNLNDNNSSGVYLRHAYGWWDVTPSFQIMAGKSTTPFSPLNPSQLIGTRSGTNNLVGEGYGNFYSGRFAQVRGTFKFGKMGRVAVALVDPNGAARILSERYPSLHTYYPWGSAEGVDYQTNTKLPRIDISVPLYFGPVSIYPSFLYQRRSVDAIASVPNAADDELDTYIGSLGVKGGYAGFSFSAEGNWGVNWGNTRGLIGTSAPAIFSAAMLNADGSTSDTKTYGYWFDLGYKFGPINPHVIFGQMNSDAELSGLDIDTTSTVWGFSVPISLAKGFIVRPELMWYDDGEIQLEGNDELNLGDYAIYGVQFQITF